MKIPLLHEFTGKDNRSMLGREREGTGPAENGR